MQRDNERKGIVTLTEHNILPADSVILPEEYQVYLVFFHYEQDKVSGIIMMHGMIEDRTAKLAYDISRDYAGKRPHLLCVLKVFL